MPLSEASSHSVTMQVMCSCPLPLYQALEVLWNKQTSFPLPLPTILKIPGCQADYLLPQQRLVLRHRAMDDSAMAYGTATAARAMSLTSVMSPKWEWNSGLLNGHTHPLLPLNTEWLVFIPMTFKARLWLLYGQSKICIKIWPDLQWV